MNRKAIVFMAIFLFATLGVGQNRDLTLGPAPGETQPVQPAWLYVIGINDYMFVQKLATAVADAQGVRDLLIQKYQFSKDRLLERYDRTATRKQILADLLELAKKLGKQDSLLIYYAGHGTLEETIGQGYWVPVDGQIGDISTWISNPDLRSLIAAIPAKHTWLVSDSCFSGALLAERDFPKTIDDRYYQEKYRLVSRQVMTSGAKEPVADISGDQDCRRHSVFACYFLKFLTHHQESYVAASEIFLHISKNIINNSEQTPLFGSLKQAGDEGGEFVLIARRGGLPPPETTVSPSRTYTGIDTSTLEEAKKREREREEAEKKRKQQLEEDKKKYFADLEAYYNEVKRLDQSKNLTPREKAALWADFLAQFPEIHPDFGPNPHAEEAQKRKAFWEKEAGELGPAQPPIGQEVYPPRTKGGPMVYVSGGSFWMGCNENVDTECYDNEKPYHEVKLNAFYIDKYEVSVNNYAECVKAGRCSSQGVNLPFWNEKELPEMAENCNWGKSGRENHPMNCLEWRQAKTYCEWAGKRLPTEAEWEKAARGTDGRKYPWGNAGYGSAGLVANIADETAKKNNPDMNWVAAGYNDKYYTTSPVGRFPRGVSPYGVLDLIGNVWEWIADWYDKEYYLKSPQISPTGPENGQYRVLRGGSWESPPAYSRVSFRNFARPTDRLPLIGFRCARD